MSSGGQGIANDEFLISRIRELSRPLKPIPTGLSVKGDLKKPVRAVVFDVYGTLFISGSGDIGTTKADMRDQAMEEALATSGFTILNSKASGAGCTIFLQIVEEFHAKQKERGIPFPEIDILETWHAVLNDLKAQKLIRGRISEEILRRLAVEYECRVNPVWPMPELYTLIAGLNMRGITLGIVSNAQFFTPLLFQAFYGKTLVELGFNESLICFSYRLGEAKPSLRLYNDLIAKMRQMRNILPGETVYVGNDLRNDILPARSTGVQTVLFAGDKRSLRLREHDPQIKGTVADLVIIKLENLVNYVI